MIRMWVLACRWKGDEWVEQCYGPFMTKDAALRWKRANMDKSWYCEPFCLISPAVQQ